MDQEKKSRKIGEVKLLLFHGGVVIFLGLLSAIPYVILSYLSEQTYSRNSFYSRFPIFELWEQQPWKSAYSGGLYNGMACFVVVGILPHFYLAVSTQRIIGTFCMISAYSNTVSRIICAAYNVKGMYPGGSSPNAIAFALSALGVVTGVCALVMIMGMAVYAERIPTLSFPSLHFLPSSTPAIVPTSPSSEDQDGSKKKAKEASKDSKDSKEPKGKKGKFFLG